ncbi:hypothetical protein HDV00_000646 [Rhizophlyctis rosea]|nr:hypothetical protein HDV00_000646 [Rhizophlyctis rosea]
MSVKSVEELNKALVELNNDPNWNLIPQDVRTKITNEIHEDLASDLLSDAVKKQQPKRRRRRGGQQKDEDKGDSGESGSA